MLSMAELRALAARNELIGDVRDAAIQERIHLLDTLVGTLYPPMVQADINELLTLQVRPRNVFDYVRES